VAPKAPLLLSRQIEPSRWRREIGNRICECVSGRGCVLLAGAVRLGRVVGIPEQSVSLAPQLRIHVGQNAVEVKSDTKGHDRLKAVGQCGADDEVLVLAVAQFAVTSRSIDVD
jgi:hypothetical protein